MRPMTDEELAERARDDMRNHLEKSAWWSGFGTASAILLAAILMVLTLVILVSTHVRF